MTRNGKLFENVFTFVCHYFNVVSLFDWDVSGGVSCSILALALSYFALGEGSILKDRMSSYVYSLGIQVSNRRIISRSDFVFSPCFLMLSPNSSIIVPELEMVQ